MSQMADSDEVWVGETGRINQEMLEKYLGNPQEYAYYIAGSPRMVGSMSKLLVDAGIDPDDIKFEEFAGY